MKISFKKLKQAKIKRLNRSRRHRRVRGKIFGTSVCPRFSVFRSNKYNYIQIVDDEKGKTLVFASDLELKKAGKLKKAEKAFEVGKLIAKKALDKKISKVVFDRGGYQYHGRIEKLASGAREGGLKF